MKKTAKNKFCQLADLGNEASVEQFFVNRLLRDLGYKDSQIKPKESLDALAVWQGSKKKPKWRPDYALAYNGKVRWICDAKGVEENLDAWVGQCSSYCLELNKTYPNDNPTLFFMLTNGVTTRIYRWDNDTPLIEASFHHFVDGNTHFEDIRKLLAPGSFKHSPAPTAADQTRLILRRRSVNELNLDFAWAHRIIYKRENLSYTAAFMEFVKVIFLKLWSDRQVHASPDAETLTDLSTSVPAGEVRFSRRWIEDREKDTPNPLDAILFQKLLTDFETEISDGRKKRIFAKDEKLELSPETLKLLVERLESIDLISIDADLNGRMFETFLNSTLRGKALGQYFTPRSVVKLATSLADLRATPDHVDRVIDACCGTGGFLIEALADMWGQIESNESLSNSDREELRAKVATESLIGVDVARDPALARIARINMYLHGDGGSSIYQLDALDKNVSSNPADSVEIGNEKKEFRNRITSAATAGLADVVLTNPPFAKQYDRGQSIDSKLLDEYALAFDTKGGELRPLPRLNSNVMFLERYYDLLPAGGRLISIVDDGILGAATTARIRTWIRKHWVVKAVISLPGDAFQRSQARVKTSILILKKKATEDEQQPSVFMYYCTAVGIDDAPRQRVLPIDEQNRERAKLEIEEVGRLYRAFQLGHQDAANWTVPAEAIGDRMDVKACLPRHGARVAEWQAAGFEVAKVGTLLRLAVDPDEASDRRIDTDATDELVTYLRVRYDGFCEAGDEVLTSDLTRQQLIRVKAGDIVISHINAIHGAVAVVPHEFDGLVVTNEFTVCAVAGKVTAGVVWSLLRSTEARADLLLMSTGIGRTRVNWDIISELHVPVPTARQQADIEASLAKANEAQQTMTDLRRGVQTMVGSDVLLDSPHARQIISAFKPPR